MDEEVQRAQAEQRERVGREDDEGLGGHPKTAGMESRANSRSVLPIATSTTNSGVATRFPFFAGEELAVAVVVGDRDDARGSRVPERCPRPGLDRGVGRAGPRV